MSGSSAGWRPLTTLTPVRARVEVPSTSSGKAEAVVAATFAAAGLITGGTVLVRNWPIGDPAAEYIADVFAQMQAYVVSSSAGLTVTSRSTSGVLSPVELAVDQHPELVPLLVVLAAHASGRSRLIGADAQVGDGVLGNLSALGGSGVRVDGDLLIDPRSLTGGIWGAGGIELALAGAVMALAVPDIEIPDWGIVEQAYPGLTAQWLQMIALDEYLVPGSARLPHEYLSRPLR